MFRESPTLRSTGVTIREDPCPVCAAPFTHWIISSYFDVFTEVSLDGGVTWSAGNSAIHVEQAPDGFPPGDYNKDKVVDASDYVAWQSALGQIGAGLAADGNWSGRVDQGDYDVWRANFGRTAPGVVFYKRYLVGARTVNVGACDGCRRFITLTSTRELVIHGVGGDMRFVAIAAVFRRHDCFALLSRGRGPAYSSGCDGKWIVGNWQPGELVEQQLYHAV